MNLRWSVLLTALLMAGCGAKRPKTYTKGTAFELPGAVVAQAEGMARARIEELRAQKTLSVSLEDDAPKSRIDFLTGEVAFVFDAHVGPDYFREYSVPATVNGEAAKHFHIRFWYSDRGGENHMTSEQYLHYTEDPHAEE